MARLSKEQQEKRFETTVGAVMDYIVNNVGYLPPRNAAHLRFLCRTTPALAFRVRAVAPVAGEEFWAEAEIDPISGEVVIEYNPQRDPVTHQPGDVIHEMAEVICETRILPSLFAGQRSSQTFRVLATGGDYPDGFAHCVANEVRARCEQLWRMIDTCKEERKRHRETERLIRDAGLKVEAWGTAIQECETAWKDIRFWATHKHLPELEHVPCDDDATFVADL